MLIDCEDFNIREACPTNLDEFVQIRWDCGQASLSLKDVDGDADDNDRLSLSVIRWWSLC